MGHTESVQEVQRGFQVAFRLLPLTQRSGLVTQTQFTHETVRQKTKILSALTLPGGVPASLFVLGDARVNDRVTAGRIQGVPPLLDLLAGRLRRLREDPHIRAQSVRNRMRGIWLPHQVGQGLFLCPGSCRALIRDQRDRLNPIVP